MGADANTVVAKTVSMTLASVELGVKSRERAPFVLGIIQYCRR
jgi:hypothetical protein